MKWIRTFKLFNSKTKNKNKCFDGLFHYKFFNYDIATGNSKLKQKFIQVKWILNLKKITFAHKINPSLLLTLPSVLLMRKNGSLNWKTKISHLKFSKNLNLIVCNRHKFRVFFFFFYESCIQSKGLSSFQSILLSSLI